MRWVRDEIVENLEASMKETDIYRVLQTGDLANLDGLAAEEAARLPHLTALRRELCSQEFRTFVEDITGCGELTGKVDLSVNVYNKGCHLLCHDDVIGNRRVSFIIYLTDPDEEWGPANGGALELYGVERAGRPAGSVVPDGSSSAPVPELCPTTSLLPKWNSMNFFKVLPGRSFHSVQEVFQDGNPRLSVLGWFHGATPPPGADQASRNQIKGGGGELDFEAFAPSEVHRGGEADEAPLPEELLAQLRPWVNPQYLQPEMMSKIAERFVDESSVQLHQFLRKEVAARLLGAARLSDRDLGMGRDRLPEYQGGLREGSGWEGVGPPHKQRYLRLCEAVGERSAPPAEGSVDATKMGAASIEEELAALRSVMASPACAALLSRFTRVGVLSRRVEARRFRPGLDYTLAHDVCQGQHLDATLSFVDAAGEDEAAAWDLGEVGGYECYMMAETDETNAEAEVYKDAGGEDELLSVPPAQNVLNLVLTSEGLMHFVKYVSAGAPGSRFDVAAQFGVEVPSDSDSDSENQEEE